MDVCQTVYRCLSSWMCNTINLGGNHENIGFQFTYSLFDSLFTQTYDTVTVIIRDQVILPNHEPANIWQYNYSNHKDTFYVTSVGDTLKFYSRWNLKFPRTIYVFPIEADKKWAGPSFEDSIMVIEKRSVAVPAGNFDEGYRLHETWTGFNDYGDVTTWLVPHVGIVKMNRFGYLMHQRWELLEYHTC